MSATRPASDKKSSVGASPRKPIITPGKTSSISSTSYTSDTHAIHIPSKIPPSQHITVSAPAPQPHCAATYDIDSKLWQSTIFPRHHPSSNNDVTILDHWITQRLRDATIAVPEPANTFTRLTRQLEVLNLGYSECIRQVAINSNSRAELLNRLWSASAEVYGGLLNDLTSTIASMQNKIDEANKSVANMQSELELQQWKYEKELTTLRSLTTINKSEESAAYRELQQDLFMKDRDLRSMENTIAELSLWFPNFQLYSSSVLRKHLPPVDEAAIAALKQATSEGGDSVMIPQDLLLADLLRIQQLNVGISITVVDDEELNPLPSTDATPISAVQSLAATTSTAVTARRMSKAAPRFTNLIPPPPSTATPSPLALANRKKMKLNRQVSIQDSVTSSSFKALLVENQLQVVVNEELNIKYNALQQLHSTNTSALQHQIAQLTHQLALLEDAATTTTTLPRLSDPFPTLSQELIAIYYRSSTATPPTQLLAVGDIQKSLQAFTMSVLSNSNSWCWLTAVPGIVGGGSKGLELRCLSYESLLIYSLYQQPALQRGVKDRIRRLLWSVLVWGGSSSSNGNSDYTEELPRSLLEHEKCMLQVFKSLLRLNTTPTNLTTAANTPPASAVSSIAPSTCIAGVSTIASIKDEAYASMFIGAIASLSSYLRSNNSSSSVIGGPPTSCNLFATATACPLPTSAIQRLLRRVVRPLDANGAMKPAEGSMYGGPWWSSWPLKLYTDISSELDLLSLKHGGTSIDCYEFIATLGVGVERHIDVLMNQLRELYNYLNGVTDGHREVMFYTLMLAILEPPGGVATPQHKMLPAMLMRLAASDGLTDTSFATTVLSCTSITCGGLALLSEPSYRIRPQLLRAGRQLLQQLRELVNHDAGMPVIDGLTAHAALCFEQGEDDEENASSGPPLSDLLYAYRSLHCVLQLNKMTIIPSAAKDSPGVLIGELHQITRAAQHSQHYLLRRCYKAWTMFALTMATESDNEDDSPLIHDRKIIDDKEAVVRTRRGATEPSQLIPERSLSKAYSRVDST